MKARGFTLLSVMLAMALVASVAFMLNRDSGLTVRRVAQQGDFERARYVAEAGLQAVNSVVQSAGCNGSFPTSAAPVTNNFGGGSYTAFSNTSSGSPVTLSATGQYNGAQVTLTRANVPVYQARKAVVLQPAGGQDTYVSASNPNGNYGADLVLKLNTANRTQPLVKFDLSSFPAGTRVVPWFDTVSGTLKPGATLSLYQSKVGSTNPVTINALLITRSWVTGTGMGAPSPNGATWNTYDGVNPWPAPGVGYAATPVASTPHSNSVGWVDWDVTNSVAAWMSGVYPNYGWWLIDSGGDIGDSAYVSSQGAIASQYPKLTVNYLQPCATSLGVTLAAVADVYIKGGSSATLNYGGAPVMDASYKSPGPERRMLLRFNMGSIPSGTALKSSILRLYCSSVTSATSNAKSVNAYFVQTSWVEGTLNGSGTANGATWITRDGTAAWSSPGGDFGKDYYPSWVVAGKDEATGTSPLPGSFRQGWVTFDIKDAAQYWLDNLSDPTANYGIVIVLSSSTSDIIEFASRESTGGKAPQLVVTY